MPCSVSDPLPDATILVYSPPAPVSALRVVGKVRQTRMSLEDLISRQTV